MVMAVIGVVPILALSSTLLPLVKAYSFNIQSTPRQCQNLTVTITGDGGQAPYRLLIIPFGPSPLPNNTEVRRIQDVAFGAGQTTLSFQLRYPENSQFVAVVSDASGFGTGGTSVAATVLAADGAGSCFDASTNVSPDFVFSIEPPNQIVQCAATRIWWDNSTVQGVPSFLGIIPGGQSFSVPQGSLSNVPSQGTGFSWTPSVRAGTTLIIAGGDNRGAGSAGSSLNTVSAGINPNNDCLNDNSPSSTPGSPAGGSYPTNTSGAQVGGGGGGSSNTGAIVGGVIGGVVALAALILALFFFRRRSQNKQSTKERPVDLLQDDDDTGHRGELPQYYQPEPFMMPEPSARVSTDAGSIAAQTDDRGRPLSGVTSTSRSGTPDLLGFGAAGTAATSTSGSSSGRKSGMPRPLRAVNIIQHEDAGPSDAPKADEDEPETIELPPAYTNIRSETPTRPA